MIFNEHSELNGRHAFLSPSSPYWMNDDENSLIQRLVSSYATQVGTICHSFAARFIKHRYSMSKFDRKHLVMELIENRIPESVVSRIPIVDILNNMICYVNDSVDFGMSPEVALKYSDYCFGHADACGFDEDQRILRIHDLKNGSTPAKMEQLLSYAALFLLEYGPIMDITPNNISADLRIYQGCKIIQAIPTKEDLMTVMDIIRHDDETARNFMIGLKK